MERRFSRYHRGLWLWLSAVRATRTVVTDGHVHSRLSESSFDFTNDKAVRLLDNDRICTSAEATRKRQAAAQIWPCAAPEQTGLIEADIDERSNVYNLGVLGLMILTGAPPYGVGEGDPDRETIVRRPVNTGMLHNAPALKRIIERATAKQAASRFSSLVDLETEVALLVAPAAAAGSPAAGALVGRSEQESALAESFEAARTGRSRVVAIIGEPGIGKTYLWQSVQDRLLHPDEFRFFFKSSQISTIPYRAVGALFDELLQRGEAGQLGGASREARYVLSRISRRASDLIGAESADSSDVAGAQSALPAELSRLLSRLLTAQAVSVVVLDDLQWLDEQSYAVVRELVALEAEHRLLVLIGRPEARARVPEGEEILRIDLAGISREAAGELLERTVLQGASGESRFRVEEQFGALYERAQGNPLALLTLARSVATAQPVAGPGDTGTGDARDAQRTDNALLVSLALNRLHELSPETRTLLHAVALCSPPVSEADLSGIDLPMCSEPNLRDRALTEAETKLLVTVAGRASASDHTSGDRSVQFAHDTIELAVRTEAREDAPVLGAVVEMLSGEASAGAEPAVFALARLLFPPPEELGGETVADARSYMRPEVEREVLFRAAERSVQLLSAEYGLRYAEAALRYHAESYDDATRLRLHEIAHQAAFLADDPYAMSRHFRAIRSRGDKYTVNSARQLWVSYAYGKSRLVGAIRVGIKALQELGVPVTFEPDEMALQSDAQYLRNAGSFRMLKKLQRLPPTSDRVAILKVTLCTRILAPVITTRPVLFPTILRTILDVSLRWGATPDTGIAFVYWALLAGNVNGGDRKLYRLGVMAEVFATRVQADITRTTILTATRVLTTHWGVDARTVIRECRELFDQSLIVGNAEWACHAGHAYCVDRFFGGYGLRDLFQSMQNTRDIIRSLGYNRAVRALSKHQQAVECLMGLASNPLELTGTVDHERSEIEAYEREGDYIALYGMYFLRAMLALYADRPEKAYADARTAVFAQSAPKALLDYTVTVFIWGMSSWRQGVVPDGASALRKLRRWAREVPVNQEHRYLMVRAEALRYRGRQRAAARVYRRGIACAIDRGYIHEAALGSERLGDLLSERGAQVEADQALYQAYSLYLRWGAAPAAGRVRKRLGWPELTSTGQPVLAEQQFVSRIVSAHGRDIVLRLALSELGRLSAADESFLVARVGETGFHYRHLPASEAEGTVTRIDAGSIPVAVTELIEEDTERVAIRSLPDGSHAAVLTGRSEGEVSVTVVLLNRPEREHFSELFAARAQSVLLLAVTALGVRHLAETRRERIGDLDAARAALASGRKNQEQLLGVLETALLLVDGDQSVLVANPAAETYLADAHGVERRLLPEIADIVRTHADTARHRADQTEFEHRWNDRVLRILLVPARPNLVISIDDITRTRMRERELERQRRQLIVSDRMSSLGMLAASTAHEVGNPNHILQLNLQSLMLMLEQIADAPSDAAEALERARTLATQIHEASSRIEEVIRSIKEFGRGGREDTRELADPDTIAATAVRFSRILVHQFTDHFRHESDGSLPQVSVIPGLIEQALINLIKNACEALPDRMRRIEVRTRYDRDTDEVVFAVCDQGSGMAASGTDGREVATPFATTKADSGGTGLGLTIVQAIVDRHSGAFRYTTTDEFATVAEIRVPAGP